VSRWPQVRAALIAFHALAVVVLATPGEGLLNQRQWASANARDDLQRWADRLGTDPQSLQRTAWNTAASYVAIRKVVAAPFIPYAEVSGMRQGWSMFASPQRHPAELHVDILDASGQWQPIWRPHDDAHDWNRRQFDHNRFRKFLGRFARDFRPQHYQQAAQWVATKAAREHPDATAVRVQLYRFASLPPERVRAGEVPEGRYANTLEFDAEALR
jgi:hypothetical protein